MTAVELLQSTREQHKDGVYGWICLNLGYDVPLKMAEDELGNPVTAAFPYLTPENSLYESMRETIKRTYTGRYTREQMVNMLALLSVGTSDMYNFAPAITVCDGVTIGPRDMAYHWNEAHQGEAPIRYTPVAECELP